MIEAGIGMLIVVGIFINGLVKQFLGKKE